VKTKIRIGGLGHAVGSHVISNHDLAHSLGLDDGWFAERTGIVERRVCGPGEDVQVLAGQAVTAACKDAGLSVGELGNETVLLHVQNGMTCLTPPSGIVLAEGLGLGDVRVMAVDGVCAEPIMAIELAALMLAARRCDRVVVCAAADFLPIIDPADLPTVGLFGAGAGAIVLTRADERGDAASLRSLRWETHAEYAHLGRIPVHGYRPAAGGVDITAGFYQMDGHGLARAALRFLPGLVSAVLDEAGWERHDLGLVIAHQPNAKLLDIGIRALKLDPATVPMPVRHLGNMGPASLLVNLSLAGVQGQLAPGLKLLLVAFGLGFTCGAAAIEL